MGTVAGDLVLGLDIGGTSTRAVLADLTGRRLGAGRAGGANPTSHDPETAAGQLRLALQAALAGQDPARVVAGVIGLAGIGKLATDARASRAFAEAWRAAGLRCPYTLDCDATIAYASATAAPDGTVLISGTGAVAAAVRDMRLTRVADGHGWLLGDYGSGFWLGREGVRAALAVLDGATADGPLARAVRTALLGSAALTPGPAVAGGAVPLPRNALVTDDREPADHWEPADRREAADHWAAADRHEVASRLVQAVNARPPVALAELAPLVLAAYDEDPAARELVSAAADHLVANVALVHQPDTPIVLAGGLLTADTPLAAGVRTRIEARWPASTPLVAGDGAAAAAWLAVRDLPGVADPVGLHATLLSPATAAR